MKVNVYDLSQVGAQHKKNLATEALRIKSADERRRQTILNQMGENHARRTKAKTTR